MRLGYSYVRTCNACVIRFGPNITYLAVGIMRNKAGLWYPVLVSALRKWDDTIFPNGMFCAPSNPTIYDTPTHKQAEDETTSSPKR